MEVSLRSKLYRAEERSDEMNREIQNLKNLTARNQSTIGSQANEIEQLRNATDATVRLGQTTCVVCLEVKYMTLFHIGSSCGHLLCSRCADTLGYVVSLFLYLFFNDLLYCCLMTFNFKNCPTCRSPDALIKLFINETEEE